MKQRYAQYSFFGCLLLCIFLARQVAAQQKLIPLYGGVAPGSEQWTWSEQAFKAGPPMNAVVAYNIRMPTLTVFEPKEPNGVAVILAPGGGWRVINYEREGQNIAQELNDAGITAFVLKYRVARSLTDDPWKETFDLITKGGSRYQESIAGIDIMIDDDARAAMQYLLLHAQELQIDRSKIGVVGFSGGGEVVKELAIRAPDTLRPAFAGFLYCVYDSTATNIPPDVSPAFVACASDDMLASPDNSIRFFEDIVKVNKASELHIISQAANNLHGLRFKNGPGWVTLFENWLKSLGILPADQ